MRADNVGMFWEDVQVSTRGKRIARAQPPIPETGWRPPTYFPDLSSARVLSVDVETWDPELEDHGPGWARGKGHIVGVSIGANGGGRWYFPMRHEIEPEDNMDPSAVLCWLKHTLSNPRQPKVGANIGYDHGWLRQEGVEIIGPMIDVQFAEALLDESARVSLETLSQKYLGEGKESNLLYQWCADFYGGKPSGDQRKNIYRAPPKLVGPYAQSDADLPLRLAPILYEKLRSENMLDLYHMECSLIPLLTDMRFAGATINVGKAEQLRDSLVIREKEAQKNLDYMAGSRVDINSSDNLSKHFNRLGIPYSKTEKGAPSFTKKFLEGLEHPIGDAIREIRRLSKLRGTFIESYILDSHINGKVYGQFHLLRGDANGTRSGRFSSSDPNLQNIPVRDEELALLIRGMYEPDYGHVQWRKYDYSQIEYRFLVHFAVGIGSDAARYLFNSNPDTDYHEYALDLVAPEAGWDVSTPEKRKAKRRPIKNINFGLIYGMGIEKLSGDLGLTIAEGRKLFAAYHKGVPFAKETMGQASREALETGTISTILGRKSRFALWQPARPSDADSGLGLTYENAYARWGSNIKRAYTHKALNRRLQGSAADLMKRAMFLCYQNGVFAATGVPRLTVHDELDFSDPGGKEEAFREMHHIMEHALQLNVPIKAECDIGPNWGDVKTIKVPRPS